MKTVILVFYKEHVAAGEGDDSNAVKRTLYLRARDDKAVTERALHLAIKLSKRHECRVQVWDIA
ncbi:MAG: hypothetical protein A3C93_01085 [Candidatus Lloydbacteria bacterium RIFCSPHIGHO2_02_FULL_54_17]|uniref:Uncharacterized protein n=1 Tax=Candidatus Lloydbacteria bacterium RIFCSPHIGHO2_02_FULL_54_17 TaxID=1798664 RepID=A0A1G2DD86_9BACT|nr:MAG: hypothetical protein A2762_06395 [Candidatus Lloydbacteria bacterium RIFCSPHIGHO2_01_FULL_54_11]OGZ11493.1 MAG: hypothetical protein A3C93_01085 [Candidatus Lloydbacteria bacterium RIFCSPHIGHO2_02_FULL_54_17]OGZ14391.1 MAG: hypothetical protein A2948_00440 [Candidatus Lloydbacteria bacterium RIFCSPLOWO2_01_FULL_54_18]OGZ16814.1 MAG: hypothetical protein A3H76_02150 [Candidatus Lloydbacteria bacterium RIFCSPLOWO2_02_FULL_54_12]